MQVPLFPEGDVTTVATLFFIVIILLIIVFNIVSYAAFITGQCNIKNQISTNVFDLTIGKTWIQ
jgi:hypothetical protein